MHQHASARRARWAVGAIFCTHGAASGTFATRVPWMREHLGLSPGWLGFALVFMTFGSLAAMPLAARLAHRFGPRTTLRALALLCFAGLALPALAPALGWLCLALFVYGCGLGLLDVAMNEQGVKVEAAYGRSVMSGLHGMWSVGGLLGGAVGVLAAHAESDARLHLGLTAPVLALGALLAAAWLLDEARTAGSSTLNANEEPQPAEQPPHFALPTRGALAIGAVGLCAVFAEGASMDWSGIYLRDVTGAEPGLAAMAYTAFACTMALARLLGDRIVARFGPVRTVRTGGVLTVLGAGLVVLARTPGLAVAGFALIGVGIAVVVPLCFAAAGRLGGNPGQSIAGVATLAYAAGLAAPAIVGWIAETTSLSASFGVVTALACGLVLGAGRLGRDGDARQLPAASGGSPTAHRPTDLPHPGDDAPEPTTQHGHG